MRFLYFIFLLLFFCVNACVAPLSERHSIITKIHIDFEDSTVSIKKLEGDAREGKYFSRADEEDQFTGTIVFTIPDSLLGENIRIISDCYLRCGEKYAGHCFVAAVQKKDSLFYWSAIINADDFNAESNEWTHVTDSTQVPSDKTSVKGSEIRLFGFNGGARSYMDIDNINITLKKIEFRQ